MRIRLDIAYAGAGFHGWAAQPAQRTVQGELEVALAAVLREPVALTVAGRTDAGVHATGQVAHCDLSEQAWTALPGRSSREPGVALVRAVNAVLARRHSLWERGAGNGGDVLGSGGGLSASEVSVSAADSPSLQGVSSSSSPSSPSSLSELPSPPSLPSLLDLPSLSNPSSPSSSSSPSNSSNSLVSPRPSRDSISARAGASASPAAHMLRVHSPRGYSDVIVRAATAVPDSFDARFSALWRQYSYQIADSVTVWNPLAPDALWLDQELDVEAMNRSGEALLGEHDFLSFCKPRPRASTVRTLHQLSCERLSDGGINVRVRADAFCHSQVRSLVGALIEVGRGVRPESWPAQLLRAPSRLQAAPVAPAHPLTLEEIGYPPPGDYAAQAARARVYRGTDELAESRGI